MIIILILITLVLICAAILFLPGFYINKEYHYYYDENGKFEKHGNEIDDREKHNLDKYKLYHCREVVKKSLHYDTEYLDFDYHPGRCWSSLAIGVVVLFGLMISSGFCIFNNTSLAHEEYKNDYELKIDILREKENTILNIIDGNIEYYSETTYHIVIDDPNQTGTKIDEYNKEVLKFKHDLYVDKIYLESPLTSWFVNRGFKDIKEYNPNATSYKDFLGTNLKTFDWERISNN